MEEGTVMTRRTRVAQAVAVAGLAIVAWGCDGGGPSTPSGSTPVNPVVVTPTLISISPTIGSTSGDTPVVIKGTGLQYDAIVTFDGVPTKGARFDTPHLDT